LKFSHIQLRRLSDRDHDEKYAWILAEACWVWNVSALSADGRACNDGKYASALHRRPSLERFIRTPQLVFLESRIASPVAAIGGV
jgi:hypothetical protein